MIVGLASAHELEYVRPGNAPQFHTETASMPAIKEIIVNNQSDEGEPAVLPSGLSVGSTMGICR
jgi:hypothetical protein